MPVPVPVSVSPGNCRGGSRQAASPSSATIDRGILPPLQDPIIGLWHLRVGLWHPIFGLWHLESRQEQCFRSRLCSPTCGLSPSRLCYRLWQPEGGGQRHRLWLEVPQPEAIRHLGHVEAMERPVSLHLDSTAPAPPS